MKAKFIHDKDFGPFGQAELRFTNNIAKDYSKEYFGFDNCSTAVKPTQDEQELIFPLRNIATWNMGGSCSNIRIILPIGQSIKISRVYIPVMSSLIPNVFLPSSMTDLPGQIRLDNKDHKTQSIHYAGRTLRDAKQAVLEIAQANGDFGTKEQQEEKGSILFEKRVPNNSGQFLVNRAEFPSNAAIYKVRIRMLDSKGSQVGLPGDNFFVCSEF